MKERKQKMKNDADLSTVISGLVIGLILYQLKSAKIAVFSWEEPLGFFFSFNEVLMKAQKKMVFSGIFQKGMGPSLSF